MVMSEVARLVQTPHQTKHANGENAIAGSALRKPRNREVTSRYKSSCTTSVSPAPAANRRFPSPNVDRSKNLPEPVPPVATHNRRFPTPNVDRSATSLDVPSPKRAVSVERRRPSPTRTAENNTSKGLSDATPTGTRRTSVRTELLWPSTRSLTSSMQFEPPSLPPSGQSKKQIENKGKCSNVAVDHTLRPSANVVQRPANLRKPTPERKATPVRRPSTDQAENARPPENLQKLDQHGRSASCNGKMVGAALSRSVDLSTDRERPLSRAASLLVQGKAVHGSSSGSQHAGFSRALSQSISEGSTLSLASQKARSDSRGRGRDSPLRSGKGPYSPLQSSKGPTKDSPPSVTSHLANCTVEQVVNPTRHAGQAVELAHSDVPAILDTASDTESVSSGGTTTTSSSGRGTPGSLSATRGVRGTAVPARFWQDAASRSRRVSENKLRASMPERDFSAATLGRLSSKYKTVESPQGSHTLSNGVSPLSPWSTMPNRSVSGCLPQPLSPSRTSPYRNIPSPLRSRQGSSLTSSQRSSNAAMMLNFGADYRRGRKGLSLVEEIHLHRILHNRLLQWRFVNARADGAMNEQTFGAEKLLYNVCMRMFDLRSSVVAKKIRLQQARQAQKINTLLSIQTRSLDDWSRLQHNHTNALKGVVQALEAAVLRVPVTSGVKADVPAVQDAIHSAFDVMNTVENTITYLLPKVDKTNSLVSELGFVAAQERVLLEECASLLATASALEVEECSIRTHLVQCEHERARVLGHLMDSTTPAPDSTLV